MQNSFGIKDFISLALLLVLTVLVFLAMQQDDRRFKELQKIAAQNQEAFQTLVQIRDGYQDFSDAQLDRLEEIFESETVSMREALRSDGQLIREALRDDVSLLRRQIDRLGQAGAGISIGQGGSDDGGSTDFASGDLSFGDPTQDISWAREGFDVEFAPAYSYVNDPSDNPDFTEGGEFVEIFEAQFPKITPYLYSDVYGRRIIEGPVCESLGRYDPDTLEWRSLLAEAWQYDPEGKWLRAKIHDDARFSDGRPVTAEDFRFTFHDIIFNQQIEASRFRSIYNVIEKVEVIDEKVVEFTFVEPKFTNKTQALTMYVIPAHFYSQYQPSQLNQATGLLMGSGPYRLEVIDFNDQWTQGQDVVLVRNDNYWRDQRPFFNRKRYTVVANNVARLTAFTNGVGDMMRATSEQFRNKTREQQFLDENYAEQWINMRSGFGFIAWNCGERNGELTPFHDKRVRRAMTHLIDRERVLRDFAEGLGGIATGPFPVVSRQSNPNIVPHPYDIDRAKELLTEAGWIDRDGDGILENEAGEPFEWEYTISNSSTFSDKIAQYLKDQCARVGIRCTIRKIDWAIFATTLDRRDFDALTMQWSNSAPESDPFQLWHSDSIPNQGDNFTQWSNSEADRLIELGRITLDADERMKVWHQLHAIFHDEQPYTFMLNSPWIRFISKEVGNVNTYRIGLDINEMHQAAPL